DGRLYQAGVSTLRCHSIASLAYLLNPMGALMKSAASWLPQSTQAQRVRALSMHWIGSGPYPQISPRQTMLSTFCASQSANAASSATQLPWISEMIARRMCENLTYGIDAA